jgi:adenylyl cyclase-associated protein
LLVDIYVGIVAGGGGEAAAVKAYDAWMKSAVVPFGTACDGIPHCPPEISKYWAEIMEAIRFIIVLASRSIKPQNVATALPEHLTPVNEAVQRFHEVVKKLPRDLDRHGKAMQELVSSISWVVAPHAPASLVKETISSAEFWTNRIKKDFKDDAAQIAFCDTLKTMLVELVTYIAEYHPMGLAFTGKVQSLQEAAIRLKDEETSILVDDSADPVVIKSPVGGNKKNPILGNVVTSSNIAGLIGELSLRQTADGSSAATGLKHVTKDQQTWRKEYQNNQSAPPPGSLPPAPTLDSATKKVAPKKKPRGLPIFEYQDRGFKWLVENQTAESNKNITVEISDAKQQVYLYNCVGVTVQIVGKFKSLVIDNCEEVAVVFDTLISSAEIVNCKKIQLQVTGVCPVFTIDKTVQIVVYLSETSKSISSFCTSLSSEMNVSFPVTGSDELKEVPIPEQFVHTISTQDTVTSDVSELYH